jgi:hypothetical protein
LNNLVRFLSLVTFQQHAVSMTALSELTDVETGNKIWDPLSLAKLAQKDRTDALGISPDVQWLQESELKVSASEGSLHNATS